MSARITARLDDELVRRLDQLSVRTGQSRSQVIEQALNAWEE